MKNVTKITSATKKMLRGVGQGKAKQAGLDENKLLTQINADYTDR
jgi:hypothetical protein